MPYPFTNDLGKNPPRPTAKTSYSGKKSMTYQKSQTSISKLDGLLKEAYQSTLQQQLELTSKSEAFVKAEKQKEWMNKLFGDKPQTLKFPDVTPMQFTPDFGKHPASKYGKPDLSAVPEEGPAKMPPLANDLVDEYMKKLQNQLMTTDEAYEKLFKSKVLGEFPEDKPKPSFYGFTQQSELLGENAYDIKMEFTVSGIEGLDGKKLHAEQKVSKQFIYGQGSMAKKRIVDDMLRQIREQIEKEMKGK